MTIGAVSRAIGPTLGAELFAWSLTNRLPKPFDVHFVFLLMCVVNLIPVAIGLCTFTKELDLPIESLGGDDVAVSGPAAEGSKTRVRGELDTELGMVGSEAKRTPIGAPAA